MLASWGILQFRVLDSKEMGLDVFKVGKLVLSDSNCIEAGQMSSELGIGVFDLFMTLQGMNLKCILVAAGQVFLLLGFLKLAIV